MLLVVDPSSTVFFFTTYNVQDLYWNIFITAKKHFFVCIPSLNCIHADITADTQRKLQGFLSHDGNL